jgi:hypothetical protein
LPEAYSNHKPRFSVCIGFANRDILFYVFAVFVHTEKAMAFTPRSYIFCGQGCNGIKTLFSSFQIIIAIILPNLF